MRPALLRSPAGARPPDRPTETRPNRSAAARSADRSTNPPSDSTSLTLACRLVAQQHTSRLERSRVEQLHFHALRGGFEQRAAPAQHHGVQAQAVFIDRAAGGKLIREVRTAKDKQVLAGLLAQGVYLALGALSHEPRVVPRGVLERLRKHDLGNRVHDVGHFALGRRPVRRHAFAGHTPEQQRVSRTGMLDGQALELLAPPHLVPADVPRLWPLEEAVEGHHVPHNQASHRSVSAWVGFMNTTNMVGQNRPFTLISTTVMTLLSIRPGERGDQAAILALAEHLAAFGPTTRPAQRIATRVRRELGAPPPRPSPRSRPPFTAHPDSRRGCRPVLD